MDKHELKEYMLKEIDISQDIINRMRFNSFLIKGWTVTLVSVALLLKGNDCHVFIAFIPLISFWYLDAYFIRLERCYRELYDWIIRNRLAKNELLLDMNASKRFSEKVDSTKRIMFSESLLVFYGSILILLMIYSVYLIVKTYLIVKGGV